MTRNPTYFPLYKFIIESVKMWAQKKFVDLEVFVDHKHSFTA